MDRIAAFAILVVVAKSGYEILRNSAKSLLDASVDKAVTEDIRRVITASPEVREIRSLHARNSGRVIFVSVDVSLAVKRIKEAHSIAGDIEKAVRTRIPFVERVTVQYAPEKKGSLRYAAPLANREGELSEHFGSAPLVAIWEKDEPDGSLRSQEILDNPFAELEKGKGRELAKFLVQQRIDVLFTKESLKGRGPEFVLSDAGVEVKETGLKNLNELIL
jgi:predicted Fe-Mo cluster-binding NifX family protein